MNIRLPSALLNKWNCQYTMRIALTKVFRFSTVNRSNRVWFLRTKPHLIKKIEFSLFFLLNRNGPINEFSRKFVFEPSRLNTTSLKTSFHLPSKIILLTFPYQSLQEVKPFNLSFTMIDTYPFKLGLRQF